MGIVLGQTDAFPRGLLSGWTEATLKQRNSLAWLVFHSVEVMVDRILAVVPPSNFPPFFVAKTAEGGTQVTNGNGAAFGEIVCPCCDRAEARWAASASSIFRVPRNPSRVLVPDYGLTATSRAPLA